MYDKITEIKRAKVVINHVKNSYSAKVILPKSWFLSLGLSPTSKDIRLIFEDGERIIIEKF